MKKTLTTLFVTTLLTFGTLLTISHAQGTACSGYGPGQSVASQDFAVPWNVFTSARELLMQVTCTTTQAVITMGKGDQFQYIYNQGYWYRNGNWQAHTYTGGTPVGDWLIGSASKTLSLSSGDLNKTQYIVGYICTWTNSEWKCGCSTSGCSGVSGNKWQLQSFVAEDSNTPPTGSVSLTFSPTSVTAGQSFTATLSGGAGSSAVYYDLVSGPGSPAPNVSAGVNTNSAGSASISFNSTGMTSGTYGYRAYTKDSSGGKNSSDSNTALISVGGPTTPFQQLENAQHVMWFGAHPDDEVMIAPLLGKTCRQGGTQCTLVVMTPGQGGVCLKSGGCHPDVKTVRIAEMQKSAQLFNAHLVQGTFTDTPQTSTPQGTIAQWGAAAPQFISGQISSKNPDIIIIQDPRHGNSCHEDHRATAHLTIGAAKQLGFSEDNIFLMTTKTVATASYIGMRPVSTSDTNAWIYDANTNIPSLAKTGWQFAIGILDAHESQFPRNYLQLALQTVDADRKVVLIRLSDYDPNDSRYQVCPSKFP